MVLINQIGGTRLTLNLILGMKINLRKLGLELYLGRLLDMGPLLVKAVFLCLVLANIGAYVDDSTMVDTWATIGSCAQIGKNCHISGGAGIGGVLEPLQASPVIIEDNCFIGARSRSG